MPYSFRQEHTTSCSYHIIILYFASYVIISYLILSHHIISHHIISYHIISYYIISYHISSQHIISYHIILYHILSYHIILFWNIKYNVLFFCNILFGCMLCHMIAKDRGCIANMINTQWRTCRCRWCSSKHSRTSSGADTTKTYAGMNRNIR